jgi:hypothetical protein
MTLAADAASWDPIWPFFFFFFFSATAASSALLCSPKPLEEIEVEKMAEAVAYEEQRRRQIEANKRKLEELQLHHLSATVREAAAAAVKPSSVSPAFLTDSHDGRAVSCVARCLLFCHSLGMLDPNSAFDPVGQEAEGAGAAERHRGAATAVRPNRQPP